MSASKKPIGDKPRTPPTREDPPRPRQDQPIEEPDEKPEIDEPPEEQEPPLDAPDPGRPRPVRVSGVDGRGRGRHT